MKHSLTTTTLGILLGAGMLLLGAGAVSVIDSCASVKDEQGHVDFAKVAHKVELYRQGVMTLAPLATPDMQARLSILSAAAIKLESALVNAAAGGPISDVHAAADAAASLAQSVIDELAKSGKDTGNLSFYIGTAKFALTLILDDAFADVKDPPPTPKTL